MIRRKYAPLDKASQCAPALAWAPPPHAVVNNLDISAKYPWELNTLAPKVHFTRQRTPLPRTANDHNTTDNQKPRAPTHRPPQRPQHHFSQVRLAGQKIGHLPSVTACTVSIAITANTQTVTLLQVLDNIENLESRQTRREASGQMRRPAVRRQ